MSEIPDSTSPEALIEHGKFVRGLARSLIRDEHRAEDVSQDTMVAAMQAAPAAVSPGSLRAWLAAVTRNLAKKAYRDQARQKGGGCVAQRRQHQPSG